jgi:thiol-disulfide isomerase/thioredoxin
MMRVVSRSSKSVSRSRAGLLGRRLIPVLGALTVVGTTIGVTAAYAHSSGSAHSHSVDAAAPHQNSVVQQDVSPQDLSKVLSDFTFDPTVKYLVYIYGPWCPDCQKTEPLLKEALTKAEGKLHVFSVSVKREEYKGNPDFLLRKDPVFQLPAVPTLYRIENAHKVVARKVEEECFTVDSILSLMK